MLASTGLQSAEAFVEQVDPVNAGAKVWSREIDAGNKIL